MDPLTHALSGALLARATAPRTPAADAPSLRARIAAGAAAAAFPDVDYVINLVSPIAYLESHRGVTHSILLLPLWALLLGWIFARLARDPPGSRRWVGVCALGIGAHIAGDLITGFGTMIFAPVSRTRVALGTTFIIDLVLSGIIVAGLAASLVWRASRAPAVVATLAIGGYIGLQAIAKSEAERFGERHAEARGFTGAQVVAHPRPVSPLNWTVFVRHGDIVEFAHVNLRRREATPAPAADTNWFARLDAAYRPLDDARWQQRARFGDSADERALAHSAWNASALAFFRWFADIPVFDGATGTGTCVAFRDLRFETPGRDAVPFRYRVCRDSPEHRWRLALD